MINEHVQEIELPKMHYHVCCRSPLLSDKLLSILCSNNYPFSIDFIVSSISTHASQCKEWISHAEVVFVNSSELEILNDSCDIKQIKLLVITAANEPIKILEFGKAVYRKKDAIEAGYYDEAILKWQDWSFAVSLLNSRFKRKKRNRIHFFNKPYYLYRIHSNTKRVSFQNHNEKDFVKLTIEKNPEIFLGTFPELNIEQIIEQVINSKPSKLIDLLYIASNDIHTALEMVQQRGYQLTSEIEPDHIP